MTRAIAFRHSRILFALVTAATLGVGLLVVAQSNPSSAGGTVNCASPIAAPLASISFEPTEAPTGAALSVTLNTNEGVPPLDGPVEVFLGSSPADIQAARIVGEGTLPAFSSIANVNGTVPNLPPGSYGVLVCWQVVPIEGAPFWQWDVQSGFTLAGGNGDPVDCSSPVASPVASIEFEPDSAAAGTEMRVTLNTNEGVPPLDGQVEAFLGSGPADVQAANMVGEGTLPAFSSTAVVPGVVPNLLPGDYGVVVCWQVIPIEGAAFWQWDLQPGFTLTSGTPGPTLAPTPTPTPSPTASPTPAPTPRLRPLPELAPIFEEYQVPIGPLLDYSIFGIEVTQGIQCFDTSKGDGTCEDNSLSLVAQKNTMARIYLQLTGPGANELAGVPVRLHMFADGEEYIVDTYGTARTEIKQDLSDSGNVWFNVDANSGMEVEFYAEVDPENRSGETDEGNNRFPASGTFSLDFQERVDGFDVRGWKMRYHPTGTDLYAGGWAVDTGGYQWLNDVWPMEEGGIDHSIQSGWFDWTTVINDGDENDVREAAESRIADDGWWIFSGSGLRDQERVHVWTPNAYFVRGTSDPAFLDGDGVASVGDDNPGTSQTMDNPGFGVVNFAHELTHNTNIKHTATGVACDTSPESEPDWPYADAKIQEFGYNPDTGKIHDPSSSYDFMSYCYGTLFNSWISPFHWQRQFVLEGARIVVPQSTGGPIVGIKATLDNPEVDGDTGGDFGPLFLGAEGNVVPPPIGSGYSVQVRAGDSVLAEQPFGVSFVSVDNKDDPLPDAFVAFSMAAPQGATSLVLLRGTQVLDTQLISGGPPTVTFTDPATPENWAAGTTQTISWTGHDPDEDSLVYTVFYSMDGGTTYDVLASDVTSTAYQIDVNSLAGASSARFRVLASDGVNTGYGDSASVSVPNKPPFVGITGPADGALAEEGGLIVLQGAATDLEDGTLDDDSLEWSSDRDGVLGTGGSLPLNTLSGGEHEITLTATDSDGATSSETRTLFVGMRAYVRFLPGVVNPDAPENIAAIVTLVPGVPTTEIDENSVRLRIGDATVTPLDTQQLGDTDEDGLPELAVTLPGQALVNAIPNPRVGTNVTIVGQMDDNTPLQAKGVIGEMPVGDADCSGTTEATDATDVLAHVAQIRTVDCLLAVDMDCDTSLTPHDALAILSLLAGVDSGLMEGCSPPAATVLFRTSGVQRMERAYGPDLPGSFAALPEVSALRRIGRAARGSE